ncbi:hypothetical protein RMR16_026915 (plasmid) [Agrobacterium sp. rho-13.3]|uniref:hypothetical protein n=1 Tax=Agrobacterium sp. rho-13.3 TaxID=3072980 RepID=UPI002A0DE4EA|nr:hypothetical protein [Agrobacterium sp. rho-13.3]MDX8311562.1 hypothetical protein [Agrobacterium sp. rho-13.3]
MTLLEGIILLTIIVFVASANAFFFANDKYPHAKYLAVSSGLALFLVVLARPLLS